MIWMRDYNSAVMGAGLWILKCFLIWGVKIPLLRRDISAQNSSISLARELISHVLVGYLSSSLMKALALVLNEPLRRLVY